MGVLDSNKSKIIDYVSGKEVYATPEEVASTQVFSKILVEDYGYPTSFDNLIRATIRAG